MTYRFRGFSTLAAVSCLLFLVALVVLIVNLFQESLHLEARAQETLDREGKMYRSIAALISSFESKWKSDRQTWISFALEQAADDGLKREFDDLSAKLNLNSVLTFLLIDSQLHDTVKNHTVDEFQTFRIKSGPFGEIEPYREYFTKESLENLYTTVSYFNLNTVDEIMFEKMVNLRTGNQGLGTSLRQKIRDLRFNRAVLLDGQLESFFEGQAEHLLPVFNLTPDLNVNTVNAVLLEALVKYPPWKIENSDAKIALLLEERKKQPISADVLKRVLGVDNTARILQYLGTESNFLLVRFVFEKTKYEVVLNRKRAKDSDPATYSILSQGWFAK